MRYSLAIAAVASVNGLARNAVSEVQAPQDKYEVRDSGSDARSTSDGWLGPLRIGPIIGVGLPNLLNGAILLKLTQFFGVGVNFGVIPTIHIPYYGDATVALESYELFARVHPFGGGWFIGTGLGYATIRGTFSSQFDTSPYASQIPPGITLPSSLLYESRGSVRTPMLTPQIGYSHITDIGFTIGADFGVALPVAPSSVRFQNSLLLPPDTPSPIVDAVRQQLLEPNNRRVEDTLQRIGRTPIPTINIRIGWLL